MTKLVVADEVEETPQFQNGFTDKSGECSILKWRHVEMELAESPSWRGSRGSIIPALWLESFVSLNARPVNQNQPMADSRAALRKWGSF